MWSNTPPGEPGFYWMFDPSEPEQGMLVVWVGLDNGGLHRGLSYVPLFMDYSEPVNSVNVEDVWWWSEPVAPPISPQFG